MQRNLRYVLFQPSSVARCLVSYFLDAIQGNRVFQVELSGYGAAQFRQMFEDEAKVAVNLNHPNIVQKLSYGQIGATYYLVMVAPAGSVLAGIGVGAMWTEFRRAGSRLWWLLPVALIGAALVEAHILLDDPSYSPWLTPLGLASRGAS